MTLVIDCHGHYTTAPAPHNDWREAQKAAFKLLLPLGALLFPTMFIVILGPALLNISDMLLGGVAHGLTIK